jgi:hypothetical protein
MAKKYKMLTGNIDRDYQTYLGREGIYNILYGHKVGAKNKRKSNYIWNSLVKDYRKNIK